MPTIGQIQEASRILEGVVAPTPVLASRSLSERLGSEVVLKSEHLQRTGSFKVRGAFVRLSRLSEAEAKAGVITASAGNHAQGLAWAATRRGIQSTVVMPIYTPLQKVEATRGYGASVHLVGESFEEALAFAQNLSSEEGSLLVHAYEDEWIMAGQGTAGLEILSQVPSVDRVLVPIGGGGLISGIATAIKALNPATQVIGVLPASRPATIADGVAVKSTGEMTTPIIERVVDEIIEVSEDEICEAILFCLERMKQVLEGAGALPVAALLSGKLPSGSLTVAVASGGNIDPGVLMRVIRHGLGNAGRYLFLSVTLPDRPGQLQGVLSLLADNQVNVVSIVHHRATPRLDVSAVQVELTLETKHHAHAEKVFKALNRAGYETRMSP